MIISNIEITKTNHLLVKCKINGTLGWFIIDTGASNSCVDLNKNEKFSLKYNILENNAQSATDEIKKTYISNNNGVKIGNWFTKNHDLILFNMDHINKNFEKEIDGILVSDTLLLGKAQINYKKKKLVLEI